MGRCSIGLKLLKIRQGDVGAKEMGTSKQKTSQSRSGHVAWLLAQAGKSHPDLYQPRQRQWSWILDKHHGDGISWKTHGIPAKSCQQSDATQANSIHHRSISLVRMVYDQQVSATGIHPRRQRLVGPKAVKYSRFKHANRQHRWVAGHATWICRQHFVDSQKWHDSCSAGND